jgi:hypothetical protein
VKAEVRQSRRTADVMRAFSVALSLALGAGGCSSCKDEPRAEPKAGASAVAASGASASAKSAGPTMMPKPPDDMLVLCSKCGKPYKQSEIRIAPVWSDGIRKFVPSHRCEGHFKDEVDASRKKLQTANDKELESFLSAAKHRGNEEKVKNITEGKKPREGALAVLDAIEKGELQLQF